MPHPIAQGFAGGLLGGLAMNMFVRVLEAGDEREQDDPLGIGAGPAGRGMQPLHADGPPADDAAVRVGAAVAAGVAGVPQDRETRLWLGTAAHYLFSASAGVAYALVRERVPEIGSGHGTAYGTLVWAVADEGVTPAMGLSQGPLERTAGAHFSSLVGHWVYGAALEATCRWWSRR